MRSGADGASDLPDGDAAHRRTTGSTKGALIGMNEAIRAGQASGDSVAWKSAKRAQRWG
jgi:hypothetical protein